MNQLMGIKHDRDVLNDKDLFNPNTAIKCMMAAYQKDQLEATQGPTLEPMSPNWSVMEGKWNERLFQLFVDYCKANGHKARVATEELECKVQELFMNRLTRLRNLIRMNQGKEGKEADATNNQLKMKNDKILQRQRHHSRRSQVNLYYIFWDTS